MKFAFVYTAMHSSLHGKFDLENLYTTNFLTGSESYFFNTARGLKERGHEVTVFCDADDKDNVAWLSGASVRQAARIPEVATHPYDALISWIAPEPLQHHGKALRVLCQQCNDFDLCTKNYDDLVDVYVSPSKHHSRFMQNAYTLPPEKWEVLPNSTNLEFFASSVDRDPYRMVYCSSPDRGLYHLLRIFPEIRRRLPTANLRIYYRVKPWLDTALAYAGDNQIGKQFYAIAKSIYEVLKEYGCDGENGLTLVGPTPNVSMAYELQQATALVYPCDTVWYTEGFGVSILDALAAGCVPIISDVDAIGDVFKGVAEVIPGRPGAQLDRWTDKVVEVLQHPQRRPLANAFVQDHSRQSSALRWEQMIQKRLQPKVYNLLSEMR